MLATLEVAVHSLAICEVAAGDELALVGMNRPLVHYVLRGSGLLRLDNNGEVKFEQHSFIILPAQRNHRIAAPGPRGHVVEGMDRSVAMVDHMLRIGSDENGLPDVITTCGTIQATYGGSIGMFDALDRPIAVRLEKTDPLRNVFEAMLGELASPRLGTRALTEALLKQCLILLIRKIAPDPIEARWLFGMVDLRLARAVLAMLENPAQNFTLDGLAKSAGMSRSSFASNFVTAFGTTPIDLLKKIRLRHASCLLESTELPIGVIAKSIGYESRTYFSRAFRHEFGIDPRSFRMRARSPGVPDPKVV
ncbi:MAG: helix-turn-helix transcriptional regulator [Gemmatimonadales bacterium]|nr:helix-turn-helix transcriptional regulator [Gemmatimonadales bacterium]